METDMEMDPPYIIYARGPSLKPKKKLHNFSILSSFTCSFVYRVSQELEEFNPFLIILNFGFHEFSILDLYYLLIAQNGSILGYDGDAADHH